MTDTRRQSRKLGVIGGSGVYALADIEGGGWRRQSSPWGEMSDAVYEGRLAGLDVVFLPRHGRGHRLAPSTINYRANIDGLKRLGVTDIVAVSACGSLREAFAPGELVLADQIIDMSHRPASFFGDGCVGHVAMAEPFCGRLRGMAAAALDDLAIGHSVGGVYLCVEGPRFSTRAESHHFRAIGADIIGMTNATEAFLAREAEICYQNLALITDYDCWRAGEAGVDAGAVTEVMAANVDKAKRLIAALAARLAAEPAGDCRDGCTHALDQAIVTAKEARDPALVAKLDAVAGRVL